MMTDCLCFPASGLIMRYAALSKNFPGRRIARGSRAPRVQDADFPSYQECRGPSGLSRIARPRRKRGIRRRSLAARVSRPCGVCRKRLRIRGFALRGLPDGSRPPPASLSRASTGGHPSAREPRPLPPVSRSKKPRRGLLLEIVGFLLDFPLDFGHILFMTEPK